MSTTNRQYVITEEQLRILLNITSEAREMFDRTRDQSNQTHNVTDAQLNINEVNMHRIYNNLLHLRNGIFDAMPKNQII